MPGLEEYSGGRTPGVSFSREKGRSKFESTQDVDASVTRLPGFFRKPASTAGATDRDRSGLLRLRAEARIAEAEHLLRIDLSDTASDLIRYYCSRFLVRYDRLRAHKRMVGHIKNWQGELGLDDRVDAHQMVRGRRRVTSNSIMIREIAGFAARSAVEMSRARRAVLSRPFIWGLSETREDPDFMAVRGFFPCLHALHKGVTHPEQAGIAPGEVQDPVLSFGQCDALRLASLNALFGVAPTVVVVMGRVGTGKSTIAGRLAHLLGWPVISSDRIRKELAGVDLFEKGNSYQLASLYSESMTERTYEAIKSKAVTLLSCGTGVVIDATYSRSDQRKILQEILQRYRYPYLFVELVAGNELIRKRLALRATFTRPISDAGPENFDQINAKYQPLDTLPGAVHFTIDTHRSPDVTLFRILQRITQRSN